ncbi:efflux RND transporter permease subunit [Paenibacillus turpanensis]|uniref:efflux RND transporter permease subunit n=1 Tax=Paenibacillus turpanensis TaxID=2689078 RepID=UPI00140BF308|nr:efflux RND transporter permease subunit [Paenibacillus turpanensis]
MNRLTDFSMKNVAALFIIMALLFGGGLYSASTLKVENFPDISFPVVSVTTIYQGSPEDVMEDVTKPLEEAVSNLEDVKNVTSTSTDQYSSIIIEFTQGVDTDKKKADVEDAISNVRLPSGAEEPTAATFGMASIPSYYLTLQGKDGMSQAELDRIYEDVLENELESLDGLDHFDVIGNRTTSMDIRLNADAINVYGFTPGQVAQLIQANLSNGPAGSVKVHGTSKVMRVTGNIDSLYALQSMELPSPIGGMLTLSQIAEVEAISESKYISRLNDDPAIALILYKSSNANAVEFSDGIKNRIEMWKADYPQIEYHTLYDAAVEVKKSINGMLKEGVVGALLASLMILVFLRNIRMTLIVLVSIPLSILITLLMMSYFNITLNIMTLGGMFIAIGRVVDDSIVVIENIYSRLAKAIEDGESAIKLATKEVGSAITSSTLATVGVFAPMGMVTGIAGEIFRPFALTLACALMASLLVALTVIPMLAKLLVANQANLGNHEGDQKEGKVLAFYRKCLEWALNNGKKTMAGSALLLVVSVAAIVPNLSMAFIPESGSDRTVYFTIKLPNEYSLEATDTEVKELEALLSEAKTEKGEPLFRYVESLIGYDGAQGVNVGVNEAVSYRAQIFVEVLGEENVKTVKDEYTALMLETLPQGAEVRPFGLAGDPATATTDFRYMVKGDDQQKLREAAQLIREELEQYPELSEIQDSLSDAKTEIKVEVDQGKARLYGLNAAMVRETAAAWIGESSIGEVKLNGEMYDTVVKVNERDIETPEQIGRIALRTSTGALVYLNEIATVTEIESPVNISREKQQQVLSISASIESDNKGGVSAAIAAELDKIELPEGVSREVAGVSQDIEESFSQLFVAMGAAVFVVYLIMVLAFGNAGAPFAILFSLPLAAIGGLLGLFLTRQSLDVTSMIGFMMLIGIVVTNAIVLIDRAQQLRESGYTVRHALIEAGLERFRPIIMTAVATIAALLPLALGFSEGTLISKGLSVVVIGGLTTSTVLTLVVVPVAYEMIEASKRRMSGWFGRGKRKPAAVRQERGSSSV